MEEDLDSPTDVSPPPSRQNPDPAPSRIPRPLPPAALQNKDGGIGMAISRPTQIPQWPLPGPIANPSPEPYQPPPGRGPPPQRPPRPSRVPSILDSSRVQDHTPVFQYTPQIGRESTFSQDPSSAPLTPSSRHTQSSLSSVGSIPDFPLPAAAPPAPMPPPPPPVALPRRSVTLGPPPSSRRGDSSFYSNASFVSPIPEESPRTRSHTSFASSAAMPESWGSQSPGFSPGYPDEFYEDDAYSTEDDENSHTSRASTSQYGDVGDESKLVRSASVGKMQKPSIVMNRAPSGGDPVPQEVFRPTPSPLQNQLPHSPFDNGTGYLEGSSSSGTVPTMAATATTPSLTADAMLGAFAAASSTDPVEMRKVTPSPRPYNRLSAIRRPPKLGLDMNSVREMESRGSMTSLPDLIKRATRLAALIDRGRRPASRFDMDGEWPDEKAFGREGEVQMANMSAAEKHQSGLSDMLAAFPPPATTPNPPQRGSWFRRNSNGSWPLAPGSRGGTPQPITRVMAARSSPLARLESNSDEGSIKRKRKCCGLPLWAFILIVLIVLGIIAAAIIVPLEFFVFRKNRTGSTPTTEPALGQCQNQLKCENGGTNVISQNVCSCICTNGFTGQTCTVAGATGCTTTNLTGTSSNINNVTLGQAIPRLLQQSQTNFTVPLDGTDILAKFNTESLSCIAQNSLVTFDGRSMRQGTTTGADVVANVGVNADSVPIQIITLLPGQATTITFNFIETGAVIGPSGNIVGGFTTLTGPFRVTTIHASSSTMWATIPMMPTPTPPTSISTVPITMPTIPPATSVPPTSTMTTPTTTQGPLVPSVPVSPSPSPTPMFTVTEETLDFARVSVLLILQRQSLMAATTAQTVLQRFFTQAGQGTRMANGGVPISQALNVTLGGGNSVDLVHFLITIPGGVVGSNSTTTASASGVVAAEGS
ncbi:hypothetical protein CkaCkLH20_10923 [Colletotrichum karsti]|uniref:EGF-like domain-containing protein n=1 Tax=Colletotrichum karsti TaxID=1095194 RepID=A0A9P6HUU3_9PEZI|nr:uncharacterized protein CkaCkLH20_10923 [Colletotrichum karsti]KAF9871512.1 hypothetical protein CkaCkLH20_10923 [Colletotrichum karsti]